jgi:hypothetical protein
VPVQGSNDDRVIAVADLPAAPRGAADQAVIVDLENASNGSNDDDESKSEYDSDDKEHDFDREDEVMDAAAAAGELRWSTRRNKGCTTRYQDYALLHANGGATEGQPSQAIIKDGFVMFSGGDVSEPQPIWGEDRLENALGVILQQYSIGAGLRKFQEWGEKGVFKELAQIRLVNLKGHVDFLAGSL